MNKFLKYFQLVKVDEAQRIVYGIVTAQEEDLDGEICDYSTTKVLYQEVNEEMSKASDGHNIMPLRYMHQLDAIGAGKSIDFFDKEQKIRMGFKVVDDDAWKKVLEKVLLGFSQGGTYVKRWTEAGKRYYTAKPGEVSLVDRPCLPGAKIEYAKADGTVEEFHTPPPQIVQLSEADVKRISKALADSILGTHAKDLDAALAEGVREDNAAKGEYMTPEQIKKCAAALGITEAEFVKQFIEGESFEKAKRGMAALAGHLKKAKQMAESHCDHIDKCMKAAADVMGDDSEKALKALIAEFAPTPAPAPEFVSIGKTADGVELFKHKDAAEVKLDELVKGDSVKAEEVKALIKTALAEQAAEFDKKLEKTVVPTGTNGGARLTLIGRDGKEIAKGEGLSATDPLAVS